MMPPVQPGGEKPPGQTRGEKIPEKKESVLKQEKWKYGTISKKLPQNNTSEDSKEGGNWVLRK